MCSLGSFELTPAATGNSSPAARPMPEPPATAFDEGSLAVLVKLRRETTRCTESW